MNKNRIATMSTIFVFAVTTCSPVRSFAHPSEGLIEKAIRVAKENPVYTGLAVVTTFLAGVLAVKHFRLQGAFLAAPAFRVYHAANPNHHAGGHPGAGAQNARGAGHRGDVSVAAMDEQMLQAAFRESMKEQELLETLHMKPVDRSFNTDIFRQLERIRNLDDRIIFLKAILYDLDQRFVDDANIRLFAESSMLMTIDNAMALFQEMTSQSWSLLQLAPEIGELDPTIPVAMMGYRELLRQFLDMRQLLRIYPVDEVIHRAVGLRAMHPFDRTLLTLLASYLWELDGNESTPLNAVTHAQYARLKLIFEHLFGEKFLPLPRLEAGLRGL